MNLRYVIILLMLLLSFHVKAQDRHMIDSLKSVIETANYDTIKIKALNQLGWKVMYANPDTSIILGKLALALSEKAENPKIQARSLSNLGIYHWIKSEYEPALVYLNQSLAIRKSLQDQQGMAGSYNNIGLVYSDQSNYAYALEYYFKALKIYQEFGDQPTALANANVNIGIIYEIQLDYRTALDYYFKSLSFYEELGNKQGMTYCYGNIGNVYNEQSSYLQALDYYFKCLKLQEELENTNGMAGSYSNIGSLYTSLYEQAQTPNATAISNDMDRDDSLTQEVVTWAVGNPDKLLDTAMYYHQKALVINQKQSDEYGMTITFSGIGSIYMKKGKYSDALGYFKQSTWLADSIGALHETSEANLRLSGCYEKLSNHQKALEHYKLYATLKDSVFNEEKSKDLGKLEAEYEFETAEIERKRTEEELVKKELTLKSRRDNLQYSGILIFMVLVFAGVFALGKVSIPIRLAEGLIFFSFLLFFEFTLVLLDPYIEQYSSGAPAIKLGFNAILAAMIFPLHSLFEEKLKGKLVKRA